MVKAKIDVDVSGGKRTIRKIKRELHQGMEDSVETLVDNAKDHARKIITENRAIFNAEVYSGFKTAETKNTQSSVRAKLYNDVEHADVLEHGATFPTKGPPVAALLPWVARKMNWGFSFEPGIYGGESYYDGSPHGGDGGSGGGGDGGDPGTSIVNRSLDDFEKKYTTNFESFLYNQSGDGFREYSEYAAKSDSFDGIRELQTNRHGELVDRENNDTYSKDDVTIVGVGEKEVSYNKLESGDEIIVYEFVEGTEFVKTGNTFSVRIKDYGTESYEKDFVTGTRVFDDGVERLDKSVQIYPEKIVGSRKNNEELWGDEATIRKPVNVDQLGDEFREFTTSDEEKVFRTIEENGHAILDDGTKSYRVVKNNSSGNAYNLRTKYPDSEGEHLDFSTQDSSIEISHVSKKVYQYEHFEAGDYVVVDPDEYWQNGAWTEDRFRATIDQVIDSDSKKEIRVKPFGSPSSYNERMRYEAFVEARADSSGWNANDIEKGNLVTFERDGEEITGRVTSSRSEDLTQYEEGQIKVDHGEITPTTVNEFEVISFEDDGFTKQYEEAPSIVDYENSDLSEYNSKDKFSMLHPEDFDPLDGRGDLQEGTEVSTELDTEIGEISSVFDDGRYKISYYENSELTRTVVVDQHQIDYYEGMGTKPLFISSGDTISTGNFFGEVDKKITGGAGEVTAVKLKSGDTLDFDQFVPVTEELPKGKEVEFWDHRAGEKRFGEISYSRFDGVDIRVDDKNDYTNYSSRPDSLYPVTILGYRDDRDKSFELSGDAIQALNADEPVDFTDVFGTDDLYLRDREQLFKNLRSMYPKSATSLYSDIESWKSGGSKDLVNTSKYSKVLSESLRIDAEIRGDSSVIVTDEEVDLARTLHNLSVGFLKEHYDLEGDGEVRAHRTLRNEAPRLAKEIWENPDQSSWEIPTNAVNNYTTTASNLEGFDRSILHSKEFDIEDDVLIAVDSLIHSDWEREGEIHIRGDYNFNFEAKDLEFQSSFYGDSVDFLTDQFFERGNFRPFSDEQILAVGSTVREMGQNRISLNSDGADRIHNFIEELDSRDLYKKTKFDKETWEDWESIISGEGKSLAIDGVDQSFPVGWETYDPLTVDTVPLEDTYENQSVDILNVNTEEIVSAKITNRDKYDPIYDLETDYGEQLQIWQAGMQGYDDYKIIAGENWNELNESVKDNLIEKKIENADYQDFTVAAREQVIKEDLIKASKLRLDKKETYNIFHNSKIIWSDGGSDGNTLGSHILKSDSNTHRYKFSDKAKFATVFHEMIHANHDEKNFTTDVYPSGEEDNRDNLFRNLFNEDGTNVLPGVDRDLEQVLLNNNSSIPPGLNPDGSIPSVVKDRVGISDEFQYDFTEVEDVPELLHPETGDLQVGDRIEIDSTIINKQIAQVKTIDSLDADTDGENITTYELSLVSDRSNKIEIWVDDNGELWNMDADILQHADQPNEVVESSFPDVELKESGYAKLAEASNIAFMEIVWNGVNSRDENGDLNKEKIPFISDSYVARASSEMLTRSSEILTMDYDNPDRNYMNRDNLSFLIDRFPYLVEAWLEQYRPSPKVAKVLRDKGYNV